MPTPAYPNFDSAAPDGSSGNGGTFSAAALANIRALRDFAISGRVPGWIMSRTQGTGPSVSRPQYITWLNGALLLGFRKKMTWGGTGNYQVATIEWEWSNDNGATWTSMGTAQANTYDANDNITASTNSGSWHTLVLELWTKVLRVVADLVTHAAATGTAVHGLGNMSTQAKTAVDIDGGTVDGVDVGLSARGVVQAKRVSEELQVYSAGGGLGLNAAINIDWTYGNHHITNNGAHTLTFSNFPPNFFVGFVTIFTTNLDGITFPAAVDFGAGGKPPCNDAAWVTVWSPNNGANLYAGVGFQKV